MNTPRNQRRQRPDTPGPASHTPSPDRPAGDRPAGARQAGGQASTYRRSRRRAEVVAREHTGDYHHDDPDGDPHDARDGGEVGPALRDKVAQARRALGEVLQLAAGADGPAGGELGGLLELLALLDTGHAAAVELTGLVQRAGVCERTTGLPLDGLLSFQTRATYGDRAALANAADQLAGMPHLRRAFHAGAVGWAQLRAILGEARALHAAQRAELDAGFGDLDRLARWEADTLIDTVRDAVARLRPELERDRSQRAIEHRFFALQPALDGAGTGYFELDPAAFAPVAEAVQAAMAAPSAGPNDITTHAVGEADANDVDPDPDEVVSSSPDGHPAFCDPVVNRSRARQRADALVRLAETFLAATPSHHATGAGTADGPAGQHHDDHDDTGATGTAGAGTAGAGDGTGAAGAGGRWGPLGRARPSLQAICDIHHLTGNDDAARAARALIATIGGPVRLTPDTVRRLACDADLQLIFTDRGEILGTTDPTGHIPVAVRRAVKARDRGCRFPGCSAPIHWADLHHVLFKDDGGPTSVDNLVALCRLCRCRHNGHYAEDRVMPMRRASALVGSGSGAVWSA